MLSIKECIDHTSVMDYVHTGDKLLYCSSMLTIYIRYSYATCIPHVRPFNCIRRTNDMSINQQTNAYSTDKLTNILIQDKWCFLGIKLRYSIGFFCVMVLIIWQLWFGIWILTRI